MKVQVTFDLTQDELIAIGLDVNQVMAPASRTGVKMWFADNPHPTLVQKGGAIRAIREDLTAHVRTSLDMEDLVSHGKVDDE